MSKLCLMCGQLNKSNQPVCARAGACQAEYQRLWTLQRDKSARNEVARRYRKNQRTDPGVYGIHFPAAGVLKVGFTIYKASAIYVGSARVGARRRGWDCSGSNVIWKKPGDIRTEAWMQATLSFKIPSMYLKRQNRLCEWFDVASMDYSEIIDMLDDTHSRVPDDLIPGDTFGRTYLDPPIDSTTTRK